MNFIKNSLKKYLPDNIKYLIKKIVYIVPSIRNYTYDLFRYLKYSTTINKPSDFHQLQARIMASYHVVEKGLAMPNRKLEFGKENLILLSNLLKNYLQKGYPINDLQFTAALASINTYIKIHRDAGIELNWMSKEIINLVNQEFQNKGYIERTSEEVKQLAKGDFEELSKSRHSLRNFSKEPVQIELIEYAINLAKRSPSVCNRQSSKVYTISDKDLILKALECQKGNRGFGHLINKLLIVTSSLKSFNGINERNQSFIDGGIYSMSLLYSLHYLGLGACPLNWSAPKERDKELRKVVKIDPEDNIIMMIGVGNLPSKFVVAQSERRPLDQILKKID